MSKSSKTGVLLINLGTPDSPQRGDVYRYLSQFLMDPRVIDIPWVKRFLLVKGIIAPFRSKPTSEGYRQLWGTDGSPLKVYGEGLVAEVARQHDLTPVEIERWVDEGVSGMENNFRGPTP